MSLINLTFEGKIACIELNRPKKKNALNNFQSKIPGTPNIMLMSLEKSASK